MIFEIALSFMLAQILIKGGDLLAERLWKKYNKKKLHKLKILKTPELVYYKKHMENELEKKSKLKK